MTAGPDYELELVIENDVFACLSAVSRPTELQDAHHDPQILLYRGEIPFSFGLWIADETEAGLIVYTDRGIRGLLVTPEPRRG